MGNWTHERVVDAAIMGVVAVYVVIGFWMAGVS